MKKILAIIAIASLAVSCNNSGSKNENSDTTTKVTKSGDTLTTVTTMDTTVQNPGDSTIKKTVDTDTSKKQTNNHKTANKKDDKKH